MDSGSACSSFTIYGQRVYLGISSTSTTYGIFTSYLWELSSVIWTIITLDMEVIYYSSWMWYSLDDITTMLISITGTILLDDLLHTSQVYKTMSSSDVAIIYVCIYSGQRLLQSTYLILRVQFVYTFSSYDTCVSCFSIVICHSIL